jgi:Reverse transcriptase (RNA-dependent DNA polymerase)
MFVLAIMSGSPIHVVDVQGAFLHGDFDDGEVIYMKVPQGFERFYDMKQFVLRLLHTLYGLIQAAIAFWRKMVLAFAKIGFKRSKADPCVFYKWTPSGIVIWVIVVDDCAGSGPEHEVLKSKAQLMEIFACDDQGEMKEYVGCKIDYKRRSGYMMILQPVLLQSFRDEFDVDLSEPIGTPALPGKVLTKGELDTTPFDQFKFRSGVGKFIHLTKWSRPDILNATRELARHMGAANSTHIKAMKRTMAYLLQTPQRGLLIKPNTTWNGGREHVFIVTGRSDSNYAACPDTRRSVTGFSIFVHGASTENKCNMQNWVVLSVSEAELAAATACAQSMLFHYRLLSSMGLKVKLPMILEIDNKGAKDLTNNWSAGGRMRHVDIRQFFLRELKEDGLIVTKWIATDDNSADIFTKNLSGPAFEKHASVYVGVDQYMQHIGFESTATRGEGVGGQVGDRPGPGPEVGNRGSSCGTNR